MNKKILLIGGNFSPELTGIGKYNGEMMDMLAKQGYECTVVTTFPYYPHWKVQPPYNQSGHWFKREVKILPQVEKQIEIFRCPHYIPQKPSGLKRIIADFSFCFSAFIKVCQLLFSRKFDIVLVVAPPFQMGLLGILVQKIKGARFLYHIQDLQIDAARDLKLIKSKPVINLLFKVERYILKRADVVSSISEGMIRKIVLKLPREVIFFPNWVDTTLFFPIPDKLPLKAIFGFHHLDKIVLYSGAIGEKQGLEAILEAAKSLENMDRIKFVICGSGPYKEKLLQLVESQSLGNVFFLPLQPFEKLNSFLNMADVHLVLQKATAADLVMPSKLTAILAVGGTAIITAKEGCSLHDVVAMHKMGILINPEDPAALIAAIERALLSGDTIIGDNARAYARQYLSIEEIFKNYTSYLQ